jgi:FdhE protein
MTALLSELSRLEESGRISKEQAEFHIRLFTIQAEYRKRWKRERLFQAPKSLSEKIKNGEVIVEFGRVKIEEASLKAIFKDIYQLLGDGKKIEKLNIREVIEKVISNEKDYLERLSDKLKIDKNLLFFVSINIASPIFEIIASKLKKRIDEKLWFRSYCPVCGSKPLIQRLKKEDGKRVLKCTICSCKWQFSRIKCLYCGTEDAKDLRFFWADDSSPYRVDVCDKCKGYIKTLDERKLSNDREIIPKIEDIATTYLDILAQKEGYTRIN